MSKIGEARKKNVALRDQLLAKNSVQLKNFFKAMSESELKSITRAVKNANDAKKSSLAKRKKAQISRLQKEIEKLG